MARDYRKYMQSTSSTGRRDYRSSMSRLNEAEQQKQQELVNSAAPLQPTVSRTDYAALGKSLQPSNVNDADPRMLSKAPSPLDASAGITAFQRSQPQPVDTSTPYERWYNEHITNSPLGKVLGMAQSADRAVSNAKAGFMDTATIGASRGLGRLAIAATPQGQQNLTPLLNERTDSTAYKVGELAGYIPPGAIIERDIARLGGKALSKIGSKSARGAITGIAAGAAEGALQEGGDVAFRGKTFDPENVALSAGVGGAIGAAAPLIGKAVQAGAEKIGTLAKKVSRSTPEQDAEQILNSVQQPRVRDRVYQYLDDAEKNARSRIQARKNRLSSTPVDTWADYTIIGAAKMGKGTIKLADWTEDMVKEFGEDFRKVAPRIYKASKEELRKQERLASKEGEQARIFNESGAGDETTFDQKISRGAKKSRIPFSQKLEQIRTQFVDDLAPLEGVEKRIKGGVQSAENSLYKTARLFKGVPEKARQIVTDKLSNVINAVEKAGYSADDLGRYALAKHAKDVNAAGYKSGFTNAEIDAILRKYGTPEMEAAQQALVQVNRDMMQELVNSGVVSKELAEVLDERWMNYIPLFRSFEDDSEAFAGGMSKALANVASPIKALKGSERAVIDPLENMVKNIYQSVNAAERNKVARQLAKLAQSDPEEKFIRRLGPDEQVGRKNVVNVKENGENIKYEVEPDVYRAMLNLDQESSNMLVNILSKPASLLRAGATLTPEFAIRNPLRDINQAYITSKSGFNPFIDFPVGLIQSITGGKWAKEFVENNGAYGNLLSMDRNAHREALQKVLKEPVNKKFVNVVSGKSLLRLLRAISDTTESATKIGEYRKAIKKGATPQEAAYRARDLMDFARAGSGIRQANRIVAFLNANIQGKSKLFRAIKENPIRTTTRMITSVTVPTIGVYLLNREFASDEQKQTIADSPDWLKDSFWLVAIPGTDKVARLPKPFDVAPLFANLPEKVLEYVETKDPAAFDGFAKRTLSEGALPMQISGLLPLIEGMSGYSFFRQGDIVPRREQGLEYKDQYDPVRTTETAKLLAGLSGKITGGEGTFKNFSSPRIMDNTIQGLTAGLGGYATSAIDSLLKGKIFGWQAYKPLINKPEAPEKRLEQQPLARAFLVDPLQSTRTMDKLYTEKDQLAREKASAKLSKQPFTKNKNLYRLENATEKLSKINKAIRAIESNQLLSAKQKREQIEPLLKQRNDLSRQTMKGR